MKLVWNQLEATEVEVEEEQEEEAGEELEEGVPWHPGGQRESNKTERSSSSSLVLEDKEVPPLENMSV